LSVRAFGTFFDPIPTRLRKFKADKRFRAPDLEATWQGKGPPLLDVLSKGQ
jgi:hypothetical protein